jgi:hypothetical protein
MKTASIRRSPPRQVGAGAAVTVATLVLGACGGVVSDTGFIGSWRRTDGVASSISLSRGPDGYHLRWSRRDGPVSVRCDVPDVCAAFSGGTKLFEYRFRVFEREGSPDLFVECKGEGAAPAPPLSYVDRLVLQPGGLELWSYTIERDGAPLDAPEDPIRFAKTADKPF